MCQYKLALPAANPICYAGVLIGVIMNVIKSVERRIGIPCLTAAALLAGAAACGGETGQTADSTAITAATLAPGSVAPTEQFGCRSVTTWRSSGADMEAFVDEAAAKLGADSSHLRVGGAICDLAIPINRIIRRDVITPITGASDHCLLYGAVVDIPIAPATTQPPKSTNTPYAFCVFPPGVAS